jgi:methylthioribose-1-phosphate isomerase
MAGVGDGVERFGKSPTICLLFSPLFNKKNMRRRKIIDHLVSKNRDVSSTPPSNYHPPPHTGNMTDPANTLRSLIFDVDSATNKATLSVLDQLRLPDETMYTKIVNVQDAWDAIRSMRIRGAPLIAVVAVLGLAVDLSSNELTIGELDLISGIDEVKAFVTTKMEYLKTSRPTAVNLFNAMDELKSFIDDDAIKTREEVVSAIVQHAYLMLERDVSDNKAIGSHGADDLLSRHVHPEGVCVVTICNTGSLATAGWGTALGVARELQRRGKLRSIAALETRP